MPRGFALLSAEERARAAQRGGRSAQKSGKAHRWTSEKAREAGKKGQKALKRALGPNLSAHMAALGRKGGETVSQDTAHMSAIGRIGGKVKVANDEQDRLSKEVVNG